MCCLGNVGYILNFDEIQIRIPQNRLNEKYGCLKT